MLLAILIIRVMDKIGRPRSGSPSCLITSMITDRHKVLLPITVIITLTKVVIYQALFLIKTQEIPRPFFWPAVKKSHLSARVVARTVQLLRHDAYCPILK